MAGEQMKLVLNVNTPHYFQSTSLNASKRPLESAFASISAKRPRLSQPVGKSFRASSKASKLKTVSSIQANNIKNLLKDQKSLSKSATPSSTKLSISDDHDTYGNACERNEKSRVSFNSNVEIFPANEETSEITVPTLLRPHYIYNKSNKMYASNLGDSLSGKPVISSLFSKNPHIPILKNMDVKLSVHQVFSTLSFNQLDISPKLISTLEKFGYTSMTLVQQLSIPTILKGNDALVKSQTGSGKTLSYALPIVHELMMREPKVERHGGLYALIIVPTRELAIQTYQWLEKLCKSCVWVVPGYLMGGEKKKAEKARLRKGINILVATPGRLTDHINNTNSLSFTRVKYLVLDEADRMLDMGYERSITSIIESLNKAQNSQARQTILLSATLTSAVEKLAGISLNSPKVIDVTVESSGNAGFLMDECLVTPQNLSQHFMLVPVKLRLVTLAAFIIEKCKFTKEKKMLVFMTTQDMVDYHTSLFAHILSRIGRRRLSSLEERANRVLSGENDDDEVEEDIDNDHENDIHFMKLHGKMTQPERTAVFKSFHEMTSGVLICTDVASRGLDLPRVNWIVQFNPAYNPADYVHRVGRTARANMNGSAVVFVSPLESNYVPMLEKQGIAFNELRMENTLKTLTNSSLYDQDIEKIPYNMEVAATRLQDKFENAVESDKHLRNMAIQGYVSFVRSYAAIPRNARQYFCFKLLHLGHCAKSFALRDPPGVLGAKGVKHFKKGERSYKEREKIRTVKNFEKEQPFIPERKVISEFDSGLESLDQINKEKKMKKRLNKLKKVKGKKIKKK